MARSIAATIENNFINGLVTEATALNFPENACSETYNCIFWPKGNFTRRKGLDYESSYLLNVENRASVVINSHLWQNAAGNGLYNFVVLQVGSVLSFYQVTSTGTLSANKNVSTIDLTSYKISGAPSVSTVEAQFAYGQGYLFVTHPYCSPIYITYTPSSNTFSATAITIYIRDTEGIDDGYAITTRPTGGSGGTPQHLYNIYNQGWPSDKANSFATSLGAWPSNADVWWLYKDASEVFTPSLASSIYRGNSPAPKGTYILNAFYKDRSGVSGIAGLTVETAGYQRPSTVAFFASRVFYAGTQAQGYNNKIYYSQIIENERQFGLCYQENEPASETNFDLLATDGGYINILDCGTIVKMVSIQSSLLIFATNGVWSISGSTGTGFTASDFTIRKLSSTPALSASSFVDVAGMPAWWNSDGIYTLAQTNQLGDMGVVSVSEKKIKQFYDDIPTDSKSYAKGFYNPLTKIVQWVYRSTTANGNITDAYTFDRVLNFNTTTGAFYPWSFDSDPVSINGLVAIQLTEPTGDSEVFKYICSYADAGSYKITFAEASDERYVDWYTKDSVGVDYDSYTVSGYKVRGDAQREFNNNYVFIYSHTEEPTTFHFQGMWDYANDGTEGQWTSKQLCTFNSSHKSHDHKRLRIRGTGLALQFRIESIAGEPFDIVGWSVFETANSGI